nr:hypothetical protein SHINE37_80020 [Rhizobiaceae bacterium]
MMGSKTRALGRRCFSNRTGEIERVTGEAAERIASTIDEKTGSIEERLGTMDRSIRLMLLAGTSNRRGSRPPSRSIPFPPARRRPPWLRGSSRRNDFPMSINRSHPLPQVKAAITAVVASSTARVARLRC